MPQVVVPSKPITPLWEGPRGVGPNGGVTQSLIARFLQCPARFRVNMINGLYGVRGFSHYMEFGSMFHVADEYHSGGRDWKEGVLAYRAELDKKYRLDGEEIDRWTRVVLGMFPEYLKYHEQHPDTAKRTPLLQEYPFDVAYKLPRSGRVVRLRGKIDGVDLRGRGRAAQIYQWETKTKSKIDRVGLERQVTYDLQIGVYQTVLEIIRKNPPADIPADVARQLRAHPLGGVTYNVIRRDLPIRRGKPRTFKNGRHDPGESKEAFTNRFLDDYVRKEPEEWFRRWPTPLGPADIARFRRNSLEPILEQMCDWYAEVTGTDPGTPPGYTTPVNYVRPYGIRSPVDDGATLDVDDYILRGTTAGLVRETRLFKEIVP